MKNINIAKKFTNDLVSIAETLNKIDTFEMEFEEYLKGFVKHTYGDSYTIDDFDCDGEHTTNLVFGGILHFNFYIGRAFAYKRYLAEYKYGEIKQSQIYKFKNDFIIMDFYFDDTLIIKDIEKELLEEIQKFLEIGEV